MRASSGLAERRAVQIMRGMGFGVVGGLILRLIGGVHPAANTPLQWLAREVFDPLGQVFLRLLFFVVVPLVFSSLALGILRLGSLNRLGSLAIRTFGLFALNMAIAIALGLIVMNVARPGQQMDKATQTRLVQQQGRDAATVRARAEQQQLLSANRLLDMLMPRNLARAVVDFEMLPLILFALLVGVAGTKIEEAHGTRLRHGLEVVLELMMRLVDYAMMLAPAAVGFLLASLVIRIGVDVLKGLVLFALCVVGAIAVHLFGTMTLLLRVMTRRSPRDFFRAIRPVLVTAFSTSSSSATLPTSIQVSRDALGVSESTVGFVLPLGATMNMSGTALYEGCVVLFVAQAYGMSLSVGSQVLLLVLAVLSAVAVAGIPGASLPVMVGLLVALKLPPEGVALILGLDRLLDMVRTVLNVAADLVTACIVDEWEGRADASGRV